MIRSTLIAGSMLFATGCATHAPQPAIYPGSTTGLIEYINDDAERHAFAAQRCGEINQQTFVALGGDTSTVKVEPGKSVQTELTIGCYTVFAGPDRMSLSGHTHAVDIRPMAEGVTRITSGGTSSFVAAN